jgi:predicted secreted protein with PEFG-CTERM motif
MRLTVLHIPFVLSLLFTFLFGSCEFSPISYAQSTNSYTVIPPGSQNTYTVTYGIDNGKVNGMNVDTKNLSLIVSMQTAGDGTLTLTVPRDLIDAKINGQDDQFFVLADGQNTDFQESQKTQTDRTLTIPYTDGTEQIEVIGTQVVPEFGSLAGAIIIISIVGVVLISRRFNH